MEWWHHIGIAKIKQWCAITTTGLPLKPVKNEGDFLVNEVEKARIELQDAMFFLGAISSGIEDFMGRPANGMVHLAGKKFGKECSKNAPKTNDILEAIEISKNILKENHFLWQIEPWKKKSDSGYVFNDNEGNDVIRLVFRDCMIRQSLIIYGHPRPSSLCYMMYGFFSGLTESVLGRKSELEIIHAGQNACLKRLILKGAR